MTQKMNIRPVLSPLLFLAFVVLSITGLMLYFIPYRGSPIDMRAVGEIHAFIGLVFVALGITHVTLNRKALIGYLKRK